ncbi:MAG: PIN domain-containing protein [Gaiellaceae bacterium]
MRAWFDEQLEADEIVTCDQVSLELLAGVPSGRHAARKRDLEALESCPMIEAIWERALEVQAQIAATGGDLRRGVKPADLLIAAAAEAANAELLHYDGDCELIERVTRQPMRWLAAKGSLR